MTKIKYGYYESQFGRMIIAQSDIGLCWLGFMVEGMKGDGYSRMIAHFPKADFVHDDAWSVQYGDEIMGIWARGEEGTVPLDLHGTEFQKSVWRALLKIRKGQALSYSELAQSAGKPKAVRAVGSAVGSNPVSLIVPCHRVLPKSGGVGQYGWGSQVKRGLLKSEGLEV